MTYYSNLLIALLTSSILVTCGVRLKNVQTEQVTISGNCGMCEKKIETAGSKTNEAKVDWNRKTNSATIIYDASKTSKEEILKRIANAGYDNEQFKANEESYNKLDGCCQYRSGNPHSGSNNHDHSGHDHSSHNHDHHDHGDGGHDNKMAAPSPTDALAVQGIPELYFNYLELVNGFIASNKKTILNSSGALYRTINSIQLDSLDNNMRETWSKLKNQLEEHASIIANTQDPVVQKNSLDRLSNSIHSIAKINTFNHTLYFQYCHTAGKYWLSKEKKGKNPYLSSSEDCTDTIETLQ